MVVVMTDTRVVNYVDDEDLSSLWAVIRYTGQDAPVGTLICGPFGSREEAVKAKRAMEGLNDE